MGSLGVLENLPISMTQRPMKVCELTVSCRPWATLIFSSSCGGTRDTGQSQRQDLGFGLGLQSLDKPAVPNDWGAQMRGVLPVLIAMTRGARTKPCRYPHSKQLPVMTSDIATAFSSHSVSEAWHAAMRRSASLEDDGEFEFEDEGDTKPYLVRWLTRSNTKTLRERRQPDTDLDVEDVVVEHLDAQQLRGRLLDQHVQLLVPLRLQGLVHHLRPRLCGEGRAVRHASAASRHVSNAQGRGLDGHAEPRTADAAALQRRSIAADPPVYPG